MAFIERIIPEIVGSIVRDMVLNPRVPVGVDDAADVKPAVERAVTHAVENEIRPRLEHLANQEPWFRSNVTWGGLFSVMGGIATLGTYLVLGQPFSWEQWGPPLMAIWGGGQALFGRWIAKKPIGT